MWRCLILLSLFCVSKSDLFAQDCYQLFYEKGVQAYNALDFETAINQFKAAKICDDLPSGNDVNDWITKAQNGYIDAIKAEQSKAQSLALTAKSILELLKKENGTKAFRYAQFALEKEDTPEARAALYECYYQLEEPTRKNFYVRDIQAFPGLNNSIRNAGFLDKGKSIFVFGEMDDVVRLFDFEGKLIADLESSVHWFDESAYSPETGLLLTTQKINKRYHLIAHILKDNQLSDSPVFSYPSPAGDITAAAVSKDGQRVVVSFYDGTSHVLDAKGQLRYMLPAEKRGAIHLSFSDRYEVAISHDRPVKVFRLDANDYKVLLDTIETGMYNTKVRLSSKAKYLMTGHGRRSNLWNVAGDSTIYRTKNLSFQNDIGNFSADEKQATYGNGYFDLEQKRMLYRFSSEVRNVALSPDARNLVANTGTNKARLWRDQKSNQSSEYGVLGGHKDFIRQIAFSPDSSHVLTASADNTVKIWNMKIFAAEKVWSLGKVLGSFTNIDTTFIAATKGNQLIFYTEGGEYSHRYWLPVETIKSVSPNGKYIFANVEDGFEVYKHDLKSRFVDYASGIRSTDTVQMVRFLSDDRLVYYTDQDFSYSLQIWNFQEGGAEYLSGYDTELIALNCSPDQEHIAAINRQGKAFLWKAIKGQKPELIRSWVPHPDYGCRNINFTKDGSKIITSGYDNLANIWTLEGVLETRLIDHIDYVNNVDATPDGKYLVSASKDRSTKLWTSEGELLVTLIGYDLSVESARFSENGKYVITNFVDGTMMIWPFEPELIIDRIEAYQIPPLSPDEKARYE